jgi:hypothetical protein
MATASSVCNCAGFIASCPLATAWGLQLDLDLVLSGRTEPRLIEWGAGFLSALRFYWAQAEVPSTRASDYQTYVDRSIA